MRDRGVTISLGDGFVLREGADLRDRADDVAIMAELGAQRVNTVSFDPDLHRSVDQFGIVSELAAAAGMETTLEFGPGLSVSDLPTALSAVREVGRPDFRLLIDTMHLVRSGSGADDLAALDPDLIGYVQLSDVPLVPSISNYMEEACFERMVPGTGELPLARSPRSPAAPPRDRTRGAASLAGRGRRRPPCPARPVRRRGPQPPRQTRRRIDTSREDHMSELGAAGLRFERDGVVGWCVIDRPEARNAFTPAMYFGIKKAVHLVNKDPDLRALIITGTGDVFSAGGDLAGRPGPGDEPVPDIGHDILPFLTIRDSRAPVVAAVNGICQAGGLLVAMMADVCVASDRATFRVPELLRGLIDATYAAVLPAHVGIAVARDLLLTARRFDAAEAVRLGLITRVVPHDQLREAARPSRWRDPPDRADRPGARQAHAQRPLRADRLPDHVRLAGGVARTARRHVGVHGETVTELGARAVRQRRRAVTIRGPSSVRHRKIVGVDRPRRSPGWIDAADHDGGEPVDLDAVGEG